MESVTRKRLDDIVEFEIAIKKMYLKLADLEYEKKQDTEEYQNIFSLLENARKIEKKKFASIYIDETVYDQMLGYLTKDNARSDILSLLENQDFIEGIRLNNILSIIAMQNNAFISEEDFNFPINGADLKEEFINRQYRDAYESGITSNSIFVINQDIDKLPDDELRRYFIYLKYFNIYISPTYECSFINSGKILPLINIQHNKYQVPEYSDEEFDSCNRNNLINDIVDDMEYLLEGDDDTFATYPYRLDFYRILSLNKARLISLQDSSFITLVKKTIDQILSETDEYPNSNIDGIKKGIEQMFMESLELLNTMKEKHKLELK
ncbi:MAG: hypothetical protein OSJ70_01515 [Bacilli bacterium]|mgnify:CR=1 FL=1|nr:hypothetical protein [Bacilli bacterium]